MTITKTEYTDHSKAPKVIALPDDVDEETDKFVSEE